MLFQMTVKDYYEFISNLKIADFIIYYFVIYVAIVSLQKILGKNIDVSDKTNPKILIILCLIYLGGGLQTIIMKHTIGLERMDILILTLIIGCIFTYFIQKLLFHSKQGLILHIIAGYSSKRAKKEISLGKLQGRSFNLENCRDLTSSTMTHYRKNSIDALLVDIFVFSILVFSFSEDHVMYSFFFLCYLVPFTSEKIRTVSKQVNSTYQSRIDHILPVNR